MGLLEFSYNQIVLYTYLIKVVALIILLNSQLPKRVFDENDFIILLSKYKC